MASRMPRKYNITSATGKRNVFDLSFNHITTANFGIVKPVMCRMMVPGDEFTVNVRSFTRLMPMPCPTFGDIRLVNRGFFVPFRSIMANYNEFVSNNIAVTAQSTSAIITKVPHTHVNTLCGIFFGNPDYGNEVHGDDAYDVHLIDISTGTIAYKKFKFTVKGRRIWDMLQCLGYKFTPVIGALRSSPWYLLANQELSMMPLLAMWRFYTDWIVPSRFYNEYVAQRQAFVENASSYSGGMSVTAVSSMLEVLHSFYNDDYFTGAFTSPFGREMAVASATIIENVDEYGESIGNIDVFNGQGNQPEINIDQGYINYFAMQSVGALQHMVNVGKITGTKVLDYLKATYGISPSPEKISQSVYLGSHESVIQIGDVMAQAGTEQNVLGQFAGKGLGGNGNNETFSYHTKDEHGFFIVTNEILVKPSYTQGVSHEVDAIDREDYFTIPELDNLGMEAISLRQLRADYSDKFDIFTSGLDPDSIFAFTPRYSRFKVSQDFVTGDFNCKSLNANLHAWYLNREIPTPQNNPTKYMQLSSTFCDASSDSPVNDYDYIFYFANNEADHFYQIFHLDVKAVRPMQLLSEALEVDHQPKQGERTSVVFNNSVD